MKMVDDPTKIYLDLGGVYSFNTNNLLLFVKIW